MSFGEAKVYFDGSHYIAIPHNKPSFKNQEQITIRKKKHPPNG